MLAGERAKGGEASPRSTIFRTGRLLTLSMPVSGSDAHHQDKGCATTRPQGDCHIAFMLGFGSRWAVLLEGADQMLDWQSPSDHRNTDPNWEADWHRGTAIGLLVVVGLAVVVAIGSLQFGSAETPVATQLYPEWPA